MRSFEKRRASSGSCTRQFAESAKLEQAIRANLRGCVMAGDFPITHIGELASSISDTHKAGKEKLVFLNTSGHPPRRVPQLLKVDGKLDGIRKLGVAVSLEADLPSKKTPNIFVANE